MQRAYQICFFIVFLQGISACSFVDDAILTEDIDQFSRGVLALSAVIKEEFSLAEEINTISYTDNLRFQLELGGTPETELKPLFSAADIAARQSLLSALNGYAEALAAVASGKEIATEYAELFGKTESLKQISANNFNLAHSLSFLESNQLVNDISFFDKLFILPERDKRLIPIVEKGGAALKKMAILLYFDIGSVSDQSKKCSYTYPKNNLDTDMTNLRLCKGGLRSIVANAIAFNTNIWKDRLSYITANGDDGADRNVAIERLVAIQKLGRSMDRLLSETQLALIAMVKAHETIETTIKDARSSNIPPLNLSISAVHFKGQLRNLLETASAVQGALASISENGTGAQPAQLPTSFSMNKVIKNERQL
jgi:hypothetical protein